jgi:hypothetical protein
LIFPLTLQHQGLSFLLLHLLLFRLFLTEPFITPKNQFIYLTELFKFVYFSKNHL